MQTASPIEVQFRSLGRGAREWSARFDLGADDENRLCALRHAHNMRASIISSRTVAP